MRVNPNSGPSSVTETSKRSAVQSPSLGQDKLALNAASALNDALQQTPAVRPEKIVQAQNILGDTSFPPDEIIRAIARLLAANMGGQDNSNSKT